MRRRAAVQDHRQAIDTRCHCGLPLHYEERTLEQLMMQLVAELGEHLEVVGPDGRRWRVPRHYLALHGLKGADMARLGFDEVRP